LSADPVRVFVAEIRSGLEQVNVLLSEMAGVSDDGSITVRRTLGSIIHDFYNCCERIFKKIAIEMNGGIEESEQWHRALLSRMTTALEGVRPAIISPELAADLEEYLSFRHVFRNIYGFELKGERVGRLARGLPSIAKRFSVEIERFLKSIKDEIAR
jgi:hypothetical protein